MALNGNLAPPEQDGCSAPMTITGKIQKFVTREQTIKKLGLKAEKTA